ncbi:hypothetical protein [Amycolatopsis coloradensis]|nr:hypothetical protein [Amycolatopsis coloradensis]
MPVDLLGSRNHDANAFLIYLLLDGRSGPNTPAIMRREVGADRLGLSTAQWKRGMAALLREHKNTKGTQPAFVVNTRRGQGRASARTVLPAARYVKLPPDLLDRLPDLEHGGKALRLFGAVLELQPKNNDGGSRPPWCEESSAVLAKTAGVSPVTVPTLRQELEDAGMVIVDIADGRPPVILPIAQVLTEDERKDLATTLREILAARPGTRTPYRRRSGKSTESSVAVDDTTPRNTDDKPRTRTDASTRRTRPARTPRLANDRHEPQDGGRRDESA